MTERKHSHYFRPFPYDGIDIYRFLEVFEVTCPVAQHIIKKAVASGQRGHKDLQRDWQDIVDSAQRKLEMLDEDCQAHADGSWFDATPEQLGKVAVEAAKIVADNLQKELWYPDTPGLMWHENHGYEPLELGDGEEVYVLFRREREQRRWTTTFDAVCGWSWGLDGSPSDIVAYAVKEC